MLVVEPMPRGQPVRREGSSVVNNEIRGAKGVKLCVRRPNEHGVHKQRVVRTRADDPDFETILCIPSGEAIETIKTFTRVEVVLRPLAIDIKGNEDPAGCSQRPTNCPPPRRGS